MYDRQFCNVEYKLTLLIGVIFESLDVAAAHRARLQLGRTARAESFVFTGL